MTLVGVNGTPLGVTEGKKIVISENILPPDQGEAPRKAWGVEFHPSAEAFEFEEVIQILGDVVRGIAQNARARKREIIQMEQVRQKMAALKEKETK